jgi:hypothetical protein
MRVPSEFLDSVGYVCVRRMIDGVERFDIGGTGFFVTVSSEAYPNERQYLYFVTAKHSVERASNIGSPLFVRVNTKDGRVIYVEIKRRWVFEPTNPGVDLAVVPFGREGEGAIPLDFQPIPETSFAYGPAIVNLNIGVGDDLVIVGLFTQRHGIRQNYPIIRAGIIAAMPEENLVDDSGEPYQAYLIEARSIGGLSGSPVIIILDDILRRPVRLGTPPSFHPIYMLLGVVRGHWDMKKNGERSDFVDDELEQVNMGIAIVTPIQCLQYILHGEELVHMRNKLDEEFAEQRKPTPASFAKDRIERSD